MSFNKLKKRKNRFNNLVKRVLFGKGLQQKKIILGKAKGVRLYVDPVYNLQRLTGAYEHEILATFVNWAKTCNCFFDIGAFDGYYSLVYKKYNPAGDVYLFEANKTLEAIQKKHFALNYITTGFHLYFKTMSGVNGDWQVLPGGLQFMHNKPLIKIDVEGAEAGVLEGMPSLLRENDCRLIIETHSFELEKDCISFLNKRDIRCALLKMPGGEASCRSGARWNTTAGWRRGERRVDNGEWRIENGMESER